MREEIDRLCHEARIHWEEATKKAKELEDEIRRLQTAHEEVAR
jgi:hypothetical protein